MIKIYGSRIAQFSFLAILSICLNFANVKAQAPTISYPTAAQDLTRGYSQSNLTVKLVFNGICSGTVRLGLPPSVTYVAGSVSKTSGTALVNISEASIADLSKPTFNISGVAAIGDEITFTVARRAACGVLASAKDSVYFITGGAGCSDGSEIVGTVNIYNLFAPALSITPPAALTGAVIGTTANRTTVVTNGGNGAVDTVRFYIVYPSAGIVNTSGTNAITANGVSFTPSSTSGDTLFYKFFGATIFGGDNILTSGETVNIIEPIRVAKCATTTTYAGRWGRNSANICQTATGTSAITMALGVPNWSTTGSGYLGYINMCNTTSYTFTITNTGTGVSAPASMYSLDLVHGLRAFGSGTNGIDNSSSRMFTLSNVRVGTTSATETYVGGLTSQEMHINTSQFGTDPDGAGGLADLDGDGQFDDLAPGQSVTVTIDLTYRDISVCGLTGPGYIHPASGPVVNVSYATMCDTTHTKPFPNKNTSGFYYYGASTFSPSPVLPANITAGVPFNVSISTTPINFNWPATARTRWQWRFILPANVTVSGTPTLGGSPRAYTTGISGTSPLNDTIIITSATNSLQTVGIDFVYTCGTNGPLSIPYLLDRIDDSINGCYMNRAILCNSFSTNVTGCPGPCPGGGPSSYIPIIRRSDNSLGFTDASLTTRISAATLTARQLQHAWYLDTIEVQTSMIQNLSFNNLFSRLRLDKTSSSADKILPLSAVASVYRLGVLVAGPCTLSLPSTATSTTSVSDFVWNLTSCLPSGTILNGDSVVMNARYYVATNATAALANTLVSGGASFFFNLDGTGVERSCGSLVPELYLQSVSNQTNVSSSFPLTLNGCTGGTNAPSFRMDQAPPNVMENFRPTIFIDSVIAIVPTGLTVQSFDITSPISPNLLGITPTSIIGNTYKYVNAGNWPLAWGQYANTAQVNLNVVPTCQTSPTGVVSYRTYYRTHYYSEAVSTASYPTLNNVPQTNSNGSVNISYLNKPGLSVQNNTGTVQGVNVQQFWDVQINSITTGSAPYVWMSLEKGTGSGNITIDSVVLKPSNVVLAPNSFGSGSTWYRVSTAGLASGASQQARVYFKYTSCSIDSIKMTAGWNCSGYPSPDPVADASTCSDASTYLTLSPQPSQVQLSVERQPGGGSSINLCTTDSTIIVLNSAQAANLVNPYLTFYPPTGVSLVTPIKVEYPRGSGVYQDATVTSIGGGGYKIDFSAHTGIGSNGIFGTANADPAFIPLGADRELKVKVDFTTDCSYTSGTTFRFNGFGNRPCGQPAIDNGISASTSALNITGASASGSAGVSMSFVGGPSSVGCGSTAVTVSATTTPTSFGTSVGDTMAYTLPIGMGYAGNLTPGFSATVSGGGGAPTIVKIPMPIGVAASTPINYSFDVIPQGAGCGSVNITGAYQRRIAALTCGVGAGSFPCASSSVIIANGTSPNITLVKPSLAISNITILDTTAWRQANWNANHIRVFYDNIAGTQALSANADTIEFFCNSTATVPFAKRPLTKNIAIGASDSDEYYIMMPIGACSLGDVITAKIQTTTASGTEQCLCAGSQYSMSGVGLPLQFLTTNAQVNDCAVNLAWTYNVTSSTKLAGFLVERSSNGADYSKVATLSAQSSNYVDVTPSSGKWFYRIKAVGVDGRLAYSQTLTSTTSQCVENTVNIYPNPASTQLQIVLQGASASNEYQMLDALGRVVLQGTLQTNMNNKIEVSTVPNGIYVVKVISDGNVTTQQVQIRK